MDVKEVIEQSKKNRLLKENPTAKQVAEIVVSQLFEETIQTLTSKVEQVILGLQNKDFTGEKGDRGEKGNRGDSVVGPQGEKGESGYTPIKGKDYFDGKDGKDADETKIVNEVIEKIPKPKDGKDGSPDTPIQIADKLNTLEEKVEIKVIKGLKKWMQAINQSAKSAVQKGGGMGNVQHESTAINSSTTYVDTNFNIAGSGYALWAYYQGQMIARGVGYSVSGKRITLLFPPGDSTFLDVIYIRT
jgi:hypothetical protein